MTEPSKDKKTKTNGLRYLKSRPFSKEEEEELDRYLAKHPISITIKPRRDK